MKLINFFVRCSKSIPYSKRMIKFVLAASIIGGIANTIVLAVVNRALSGRGSVATALIWLFGSMALVAAFNKALSKIMLVRLYTGTMFNLRMEMSQQILKAPLRHLEQLGSHRVLTSFTEDAISVYPPGLRSSMAFLMDALLSVSATSRRAVVEYEISVNCGSPSI